MIFYKNRTLCLEHCVATQTYNSLYIECSLQYTVSNQGAVQLILNRYMYSLNYRYRDNRRQWKCVDGRDYKCPAKVVTKDNIVLRRISAHTHAYHDKKILKKVMANCVYSAIQDAEASTIKKKEPEYII